MYSMMQNVILFSSINQYSFFFIVFRLYIWLTIQIPLGKKMWVPCEFQWANKDVSQKNDEFIFTMPSGKKGASVFPSEFWGRERFKALKTQWCSLWCSIWPQFHSIGYLPQDFAKYIELSTSMTCFQKLSALTESQPFLHVWVSSYISSLRCPKMKQN